MDHCCAGKGEAIAQLAQKAEQRRVLLIVTIVNLVMFFLEFGAGVAARSTALMADSVDMLGDALIYLLSLFALTRGARWEAGAALTKGGLILALGVGIFVEIAHKIANGVPPSSPIMLGFGSLALVANLSCLALLWRFRRTNVNMSSTFECSRNDVMSNLGVLAAAGMVAWTASSWPDIAIGGLIALLFLRSAWTVLRDGWSALRVS